MKKFVLLLTMIILCLVLTSCTKSLEIPFTLKYEEATQSCVLKNVSDDNYTDLKITVVLQVHDDFDKEITREIGELESGQETVFDITEISEDTQLEDVTLKSYDYYSDTVLAVIMMVLVAILAIVFVIWIILIIYDMFW